MRIDFTEHEEPKGFQVIPKGYYGVICSNAEDREVKNGKNQGKPAFNLEFTINDGGEYDGQKIFDFTPVLPPSEEGGKKKKGTYGRIKQLLRVTGVDVDSELDLDDLDGDGQTLTEHMDGQELIINVGIQKGNTDPNTGQTYQDRNNVISFHSTDESQADLP